LHTAGSGSNPPPPCTHALLSRKPRTKGSALNQICANGRHKKTGKISDNPNTTLSLQKYRDKNGQHSCRTQKITSSWIHTYTNIHTYVCYIYTCILCSNIYIYPQLDVNILRQILSRNCFGTYSWLEIDQGITNLDCG